MSATVRFTPGTGAPRRRHAHPSLTLAVIVAAQLMIMLDATVVTVALPEIRSDLGFSATGLSWVMTLYSLAFGGLLLLGGRAGDLFGRRRMFLVGVALFTVSSLLGGLAPTAGWLLAARAAQGVGAALAAPGALALVVTNFDGAARTRGIAALSAVGAAGGSVGLILGGMLTSWVSWRWILFINVPIGVAVLVLAPLVVTETERHRGRMDVAGALTATLAMVGLVYGCTHASTAGWASVGTVTALVGAAVLLALFLLVQARAAAPLLPLRLFADRNRSGGYAVMLLVPAAMLGAFFFLSQYLGEALRYDALRTGLAFLPMMVLVVGIARLAPRLMSRIGTRPLMAAGAVLITAGDVWLTRLDAGDGYLVAILGPMLLLGAGVGCSFVPASTTILATVPAADSGAASGTLQTMQQVGGALGLAVLATVFAVASRHATAAGADPHAAMAHGIDAAFLGSTIVTVTALLVVLLVLRRPRPA